MPKREGRSVQVGRHDQQPGVKVKPRVRGGVERKLVCLRVGYEPLMAGAMIGSLSILLE